MRSQEVEAWVLDVVTRVRGGGRVEDSRVECKADWIDEPKAARRLAGHANAAGGEPILWVVGLDEDAGEVKNPTKREPAEWWDRVRSSFDGVAPDLEWQLSIPVPREEQVVALLIGTTRAPYVVKNQTGQGQIDREVPWRDGTAIRSAHRHDLIRILVPFTRLPEVEVVGAQVDASFESPDAVILRFASSLFLTPITTPMVFPQHRMAARLGLMTASEPQTQYHEFAFTPNVGSGARGTEAVVVREDAVVLNEPATLRVTANTRWGPIPAQQDPDLVIPQTGGVVASLTFGVAGLDIPLVLDIEMGRVGSTDQFNATFRYP